MEGARFDVEGELLYGHRLFPQGGGGEPLIDFADFLPFYLFGKRRGQAPSKVTLQGPAKGFRQRDGALG